MKPIAIFRHTSTEGPGYLAEFLDERKTPWQLIAIDAGDAVPHSVAAYSGLVFMGGPMSVNDDLPWIAPVLALIREAVAGDIPVLGHCLGGQLISKALGGTVSRNPVSGHARSPLPNPLPQIPSPQSSPASGRGSKREEQSLIPAGEGANESLRELQIKEIGWGEVAVADNDTARDWFGEVRHFNAFHWHGETFSLPQGAVHLLSSAYCANQAYAIGKHLALQCHVEMTAAMIATWCEVGADEIAAASASPAVQSSAEMQQQITRNLPRMQEAARHLYIRWITGLHI